MNLCYGVLYVMFHAVYALICLKADDRCINLQVQTFLWRKLPKMHQAKQAIFFFFVSKFLLLFSFVLTSVHSAKFLLLGISILFI